MKISNSTPAEPAAPPGGNIENRKPPPEPSAPSSSDGVTASNLQSVGVGNLVDVTA